MNIISRENFYSQMIKDLILDNKSSILICGGGQTDKFIFESLGFKNVTITNLDTREGADELHPFKWDFQDAEALTYKDNSFDYVVIHAAIHHTSRPHLTITELYRVAKNSVIIFESRDSLILRVLTRFHIVEEYECSAVYYNGMNYGGINNSEIPNYIYRWTERELIKTIKSYEPKSRPVIDFYYATSKPAILELDNKNIKTQLIKITFFLIKPLIFLFTRIFKKQQNLLCVHINKLEAFKNTHPWIKLDYSDGYSLNRDWLSKNI